MSREQEGVWGGAMPSFASQRAGGMRVLRRSRISDIHGNRVVFRTLIFFDDGTQEEEVLETLVPY